MNAAAQLLMTAAAGQPAHPPPRRGSSPASSRAGNSGRTLRLFRNPPKGAMPC